jgi:adenosylmethionine-8-amino-7-oxononanoate aminotransferase
MPGRKGIRTIVVAKGLGAGYSPLGAVLAPASLVDELASLGGFESSYSYNANPISCAVGLAVLEEIERLNLLQRADVCGTLLRRGLEEIAERCIRVRRSGRRATPPSV